jgi:hypothetical protein
MTAETTRTVPFSPGRQCSHMPEKETIQFENISISLFPSFIRTSFLNGYLQV